MREPRNIKEILSSNPDFIGFIFYKDSKRLVNAETLDYLENQKISAKKVGVFVNHNIVEVISLVYKYNLDLVQLHGTEPIAYVQELCHSDISIIKAFSIDKEFNWDSLSPYLDKVDYFLFDTACSTYGGSGIKFDWGILEEYKHDKPFFLSGGISIKDTDELKALNIPTLHAVDINSQFETEPGLKNHELVSSFLNNIRDDKLPS